MKNARIVVGIIFVMVMFVAFSPVWAGATDDVASCVVFLKQDAPVGKKANNGSGFLVNRNNKPFLVTACHVANSIGENFSLIMPGSGGQAIRDKMQGVKWHTSSTADVAIIPLYANNQEKSKQLLGRCISADLLTARPLPPSRDYSLIALGYPLSLGTTGFMSPLSLETRAASGFVSMERFDTKKTATFILLQSPSTSGLSGGPVFDIGRSFFDGKNMNTREGVSLVGLVHGVVYDKTGGKFAMVVPSTEIAKLLDSASLKALYRYSSSL